MLVELFSIFVTPAVNKINVCSLACFSLLNVKILLQFFVIKNQYVINVMLVLGACFRHTVY